MFRFPSIVFGACICVRRIAMSEGSREEVEERRDGEEVWSSRWYVLFVLMLISLNTSI